MHPLACSIQNSLVNQSLNCGLGKTHIEDRVDSHENQLRVMNERMQRFEKKEPNGIEEIVAKMKK